MDKPIYLLPHDPSWVEQFEQERAELFTLAKDKCISIEHVGSTAIANISAKPTIDIMMGVDSLKQAQPLIERLKKLDYCYYPYKTDEMHWFCKPSPEVRRFHLHIVRYQSLLWKQRLYFRDTLRNNQRLAQDYETLKHGLAHQYPNNREAYTQGKSAFVKQVVTELSA